MAEELINFELPVNRSSIIKVIGVGGGGGNAVNHMFRLGIKDVKVGCCLSCEEKDPSPPDLPNSRTGELYDDFRWHS